MATFDNSTKEAVISNHVITRFVDEAAWSDQLMKPIAVVVHDRMCYHVQDRLAEERFLHSEEHPPTGKDERVPSRHGPRGEKRYETDSTAGSSDTVEVLQDRSIRLVQNGKKEHHSSWADKKPFRCDRSEQSEDKID